MFSREIITDIFSIPVAPIFVQSAPDTDLFTVPLNLSTLMLEHKIEGRPLPTVQWFKDGVPLSVMPKLFKLETTNSLVDQYKYRVTSKLLFVGEYNK